jgi:phosphoribosyl 1,2-cyclic phosphodiesterase
VEVLVLASGSSGNAALITAGETSLLVDAGISALALRTRLAEFGRRVEEITAILLTHEHSDHVKGLEVLLKRTPLPVFATAGTWSQLRVHAASGGELLSGRELRLGGLTVHPVATSHDACEPVAMAISDGGLRLGLCTDTGVFTTLLAQRFAGCDVLLIEANHDADMLRHGPYPWPLKQRIASRHGHLANHQTAEALDHLGLDHTRAVVALHLSEHNNQPSLVREVLEQASGARMPVGAVSRHDMLRVDCTGDGAVLEARPVPASRRRRSETSG